MKGVPHRLKQRLLSAVGLFFLLLPHVVQAQHTYAEATRIKLQTPVHLKLGVTTVAQVMASLSAQVGVPCAASDYLQSHRLVMQMDDVSAIDVLNTLAELYGWRWYETEDRHVVLTHQKTNLPQSIAEVPAAFRAALPRDFFRFLGGEERLLSERDLSLLTLPQRVQLTETNLGFNRGEQFQMYNRLNDYRRTHYDWLEPSFFRGKPVPFARLTPPQQECILGRMVLQSLCQSNDVMGHQLLQTNLYPHELDITKTEITMHKDGKERMVRIGSTRKVGNDVSGFGVGATIDSNAFDTLLQSLKP